MTTRCSWSAAEVKGTRLFSLGICARGKGKHHNQDHFHVPLTGLPRTPWGFSYHRLRTSALIQSLSELLSPVSQLQSKTGAHLSANEYEKHEKNKCSKIQAILDFNPIERKPP
ncbi:hypothetical protein AVEN_271281-1 [Araneus ventricosus]|uniref:Uncharacterized protein n=1 Tax=Araneus ventricosus TaxID=182803 RepID=A0A4Y2JQ77_ARAVE|nr:hypothetical protein AVEN_271281-1 [Araneus ventricosus]